MVLPGLMPLPLSSIMSKKTRSFGLFVRKCVTLRASRCAGIERGDPPALQEGVIPAHSGRAFGSVQSRTYSFGHSSALML